MQIAGFTEFIQKRTWTKAEFEAIFQRKQELSPNLQFVVSVHVCAKRVRKPIHISRFFYKYEQIHFFKE